MMQLKYSSVSNTVKAKPCHVKAAPQCDLNTRAADCS